MQEKNYKEAAREFRTAVDKTPEDAQANLLLGLALANTGELDEAVKYSTISVKLDPSYPGYYNLGLIHANQGKYAEAIEAYENAVKLNPTSFQAWHQLGKVYATDLKFNKAIEAYGKVIELNPRFPDAYQGLGSADYWNDDLTGAKAQVEKLRTLKFATKADELERWIKDKEAKKKKAAGKSEKAANLK